MSRKPSSKLFKPAPENREVARLRPSYTLEKDKVKVCPGESVRPLLLALLARQGGAV